MRKLILYFLLLNSWISYSQDWYPGISGHWDYSGFMYKTSELSQWSGEPNVAGISHLQWIIGGAWSIYITVDGKEMELYPEFIGYIGSAGDDYPFPEQAVDSALVWYMAHPVNRIIDERFSEFYRGSNYRVFVRTRKKHYGSAYRK